MKGFLPADEPATRKNPLYRSIFDGFDKIDGKPTEAERKVRKLEVLQFLGFATQPKTHK